MPKPSSVTGALVQSIANAILASGEYPSINRVQQELRAKNGGPGSTLVVSRLLEEWKASLSRNLVERADTAEETEVKALAAALADQAKKMAGASFAQERKEIERMHAEAMQASTNALDQLRTEFDALSVLHQREQATSSSLSNEVQSLQTSLEDANAVALKLEASLAISRQEVAEKVALISDANEALKSLEEKAKSELEAQENEHQINLNSIKSRHSQDLLDMKTSHLQAINQIATSHASELQAMRNSADGERHHLLRQLDEERLARKKSENNMEAQISALQKKIDASAAEIMKLTQALNSEIARVKIAEGTSSALLSRFDAMMQSLSEKNKQIEEKHQGQNSSEN